MTSLLLALYVAAVPTVTVTGKVLTPSGVGLTSGSVTCRLTTPGSAVDADTGQAQEISGESTVQLGAGGTISMPIVPNDALLPTGTRYTCQYRGLMPNGRVAQWARQWQLVSFPTTQDIGSVPVPTYPLGATMRAATPTFSVADGSYINPGLDLSITANTPSSVIYYTADGSTPTTSSTIYTTPIPLSQFSNRTATVKAVAAPITGWSLSSVASTTFTGAWYSALKNPGCYASGTVYGDGTFNVTRATTQTRTAGSVTCAANELAVEAEGASVWKAATQLYPTPTAPAAGTVTHTATASHIFWVTGTGSQTITASGTLVATGLPCTATQAAPCIYTVTTLGATPTATLGAVTGSLTQAQVEATAVGAVAYATPFIPALGTRNASSVTVAPPTLGSRWCITVQFTPRGRPWYVATTIQHPWTMGSLSAANSAWLGVNGGSLIFSVYDNATALKQVTWTLAATSGSRHVISACNDSGALSLYWDGTSVGTGSGAGTGVFGANPAKLYLGSTSSGIRHADGNLANLNICHEATSIANCLIPPNGLRIYTLGDSITAGSGIQAPYPTVLLTLLDGTYLLSNYGVGGYTTAQILSTWTNTVRALGPSRVMLMGGVNSVRTGVSAASAWADLKTVVDEAVADGAVVGLGTVTPFYGRAEWTAGYEVERQTLNASIRAYCNGGTIRCWDADAAIRDPSDVRRILPTYDLGDHIHPNQAGANALAAAAATTFP